MQPEEIQVWEGDGHEPPAVTRMRKEREARAKAVSERLERREAKVQVAKAKADKPLILPCIRFQPRALGNRCHFIFATRDFIDGEVACRLFPGTKMKSLTIRYPEADSPDALQYPVGWCMHGAKIEHFRLLYDPMHYEDHGEHGREPMQDGPFEWSMTVEYDRLENVSKLLTQQMKRTFCIKD